MFFLFFATGYTGYLGYQWRRVRRGLLSTQSQPLRRRSSLPPNRSVAAGADEL